MPLLGERLKQERESRGISIFQVEIDTRIRAAVLQMIEDGDYAHLPPEPFLRGLVRSYSNYLRINSEDALDLLSVDLIAPPLPPRTAVPAARPISPVPPVQPASPPTFAAAQAPMPEPTPTIVTRPQAGANWVDELHRLKLPLPVIISVALVVAFVCVIIGAVAFSQLSSVLPSTIASASTTTRVPGTNTPTAAAGAPATTIPILRVTAAPFPTFPGNATATPKVVPRRTIEVQTGLNVDIDANGSIKVLVGVDNVPVFNGTMDPGTTRSWSAKESIYVRVENAGSAVLYFNGKEQLAAVFAERTVMERRWQLDKGTPIRTAPFTPAPPTATRAFTSTPAFTITPVSFDSPTPTPTPF